MRGSRYTWIIVQLASSGACRFGILCQPLSKKRLSYAWMVLVNGRQQRHGWQKVRNLSPLWQINFPHSLGLLYSAFTYYTGFRVNSGEYKLMGLAPYGEAKYVDLILDNLVDVKQDGSFRLDMSFFNFASGLTMTSKKFHDLFGGDPRKPESDIRQRDMDIASSIQVVTEDIVLRSGKKTAAGNWGRKLVPGWRCCIELRS
jgi:predicted NodU family carbamoyl transferase